MELASKKQIIIILILSLVLQNRKLIFRTNGNYFEQIGVAIANTNNPSKFIVTFEFGPTKVYSEYLVLDTDYTNYTLVYSCKVAMGTKYEHAWILSRKRILNDSTINYLYNKLDSYGIDKNNFVPSDQLNCYTETI